MLAHLVGIARGLGIRYLEAEVMPENRPMMAVFRRSGLPMTEAVHEGVLHVELRLDEGAEGGVGAGSRDGARPAAAPPVNPPRETGAGGVGSGGADPVTRDRGTNGPR